MRAMGFILLAFCLVACKKQMATPPATTRIFGQVFVVLQNRDTIKISGSDVKLVEWEEATNQIRRVNALCQTNEAATHARIATITARLSELVNNPPKTEQLEEYYHNWERVRDKALDARYSPRSPSQEVPDNQYNMAQGKMNDLRTKINVLNNGWQQGVDEVTNDFFEESQKLAHWTNCEVFFSGSWLTEKTNCMTDADGRFHLDVAVDRPMAIVVFASRKSIAGDESYGWIIPASTNGEMLLNNRNMIHTPDATEK